MSGRRRALVISLPVLAIALIAVSVAIGDTVRCDGGACVGTRDDDRLRGTRGSDQIRGRAGDDELHGDRGDDLSRAVSAGTSPSPDSAMIARREGRGATC